MSRKRRKKFTRLERENIIRDRADGLTYASIAHTYSCSPAAIHNVVVRAKRFDLLGHKDLMPLKHRIEIAEEHLVERKPVKEIAEDWKVSTRFVYDMVEKYQNGTLEEWYEEAIVPREEAGLPASVIKNTIFDHDQFAIDEDS